MKNPFVQMAIIAAAMSSAFQENVLREAGSFMHTSGGRGSRGEPGPRNPAGTKLLRQFYRAKHGIKGTREEALKWYASQRES